MVRDGAPSIDGEKKFEDARQISTSIKPPSVSCRSWLVSDASTGKPLLWHNPTARLQPASITKVVTALVILEYIDKQSRATVKGSKASKSSKSSTMRNNKAAMLDEKCQVSSYAASFAAWVPGVGWNQGTNAQVLSSLALQVQKYKY